MQRCWQGNPKSRCTFSQVADELQGLLARDQGDVGADQTGRLGPDQGAHSSQDYYLIAMKTISQSGVDGPLCAQDSHMDTKAGQDSDSDNRFQHYANRQVIRYK